MTQPVLVATNLEELSTSDLIKWVDTVADDDNDLIFDLEAQKNDMKKAFRENNVTGKQLAACEDASAVKKMIKTWKDSENYTYLKKQLWIAIETQNCWNDPEDNEDEESVLARLKNRANSQRERRDTSIGNENDLNNNNNNNNNNNKNGAKGGIEIVAMYNGKTETLKARFERNDSVSYLLIVICEAMGLAIDSHTKEGSKTKLRAYWKNNVLDENKTLEQVGFKFNGEYNPSVSVYYRVVGGASFVDRLFNTLMTDTNDEKYETSLISSYSNKNSNDSSNNGSMKSKHNKNAKTNNNNSENSEKKIILNLDPKCDKRQRIPDFTSKTGIEASLKPDCIMGYDSKRQLRVEMPCGHVFAPKTIFRLAKMYAYNPLADGITCPIKECKNSDWDYNAIAAAADFDEIEKLYFSNLFEKRALLRSGKFKQCGGCSTFVKLPNELGRIRVRCPADACKNRNDFCWTCGQDWKGGGFSLCGNSNCATMQINEILAQCPLIEPKYLDGLKCPSMRACPRCLKIIEWDSECKHMTCYGCKQKFCFVCLGLYDHESQSWPEKCRAGVFAHRGQCQVARAQRLKG